MVRLIPGGFRPPGPDYKGRWGMEDGKRREKDDSVALKHSYTYYKIVSLARPCTRTNSPFPDREIYV